MFSEGVLNDPINPDYQPPKAEITYEVEFGNAGQWSKHEFVRGVGTDDKEMAERAAEEYRAMLFKARIIRVETIRSQMPS